MEKKAAIKYWSLPAETVLEQLGSSPKGISEEEAGTRLKEYGANQIKAQEKTTALTIFFNQFKNLIIWIMMIATVISAATGDLVNSLIIFAIVMVSIVLSALQEYSASNAVNELRSRIRIQSSVLRGGEAREVPAAELVPGDIVLLSAGSLIPADGLLLKCDLFNVNQSVLTGESYSVEKRAGPVPEDADVSKRDNCVFMGTNVRSGSATMLVTRTGEATEFGKIAKELVRRPPETEFSRGIRRFSYLLALIMLILTVLVFVVNVVFNKPVIDSLLFSVALAIGITPQLLPAIINITLAKGSQAMAKEGVIVRRLNAIENFGGMDILCTDKTGTLTEGVIRLDGALDADGKESEEVFRLAYLNARLQTGMINDLDAAVSAYKDLEIGDTAKQGEIPFDFTRMRVGVAVREETGCRLIVKGALNHVLGVCTRIQAGGAEQALDQAALDGIRGRMTDWSGQGFRVIGVAQKPIAEKEDYEVRDEADMTFMGFLLFFDPPKEDVPLVIGELKKKGVQLRLITGDNRLVAAHIAKAIGLEAEHILTGEELSKLADEALPESIEPVTLFAEVTPEQKERIIQALKKKGHIVGFMGDGINDALALHSADVSISVNTAVDVAKESADFVLQEKSLMVLDRGIELGRTIFANTLKYIYITTSANFGNMFSMAGFSLLLPFLPMLPKQILLVNLITDFPAMTIAGDYVDENMIRSPRRWDIRSIRNFMFLFGFISSAFDFFTFAVLLLVFHAPEELFQSGWFVLSILTELLILLVARTRGPFFKSRPAPMLVRATVGVGILALALPYLPGHGYLSLVSLPPNMLLALLGIAALYIVTTEIGKRFYYRSGIRNS
ncbi:magnesium-translocating P-type ATPase [Papillibacter cinnamivorans]|uniref:Magnesium-transporting ATPase, P-type 1 n=1 Tax=Papillibacter cinnamivorans DSM 12816 TaxID=1122930 RepID=A0A1W1ZIU0_9FIRM|nr:magnesium-translocating P-type ATPase [Papillibacter cinnamivorans]SMC48296.1 Mg2+-importing ATPase [Papillibacter cinnamivorans DSM 12816]